jgi:hypothetical protein
MLLRLFVTATSARQARTRVLSELESLSTTYVAASGQARWFSTDDKFREVSKLRHHRRFLLRTTITLHTCAPPAVDCRDIPFTATLNQIFKACVDNSLQVQLYLLEHELLNSVARLKVMCGSGIRASYSSFIKQDREEAVCSLTLQFVKHQPHALKRGSCCWRCLANRADAEPSLQLSCVRLRPRLRIYTPLVHPCA